jgi:hypothetical protein
MIFHGKSMANYYGLILWWIIPLDHKNFMVNRWWIVMGYYYVLINGRFYGMYGAIYGELY